MLLWCRCYPQRVLLQVMPSSRGPATRSKHSTPLKSFFPQLLYCTTLSQMLRLSLQLTPLTSQLEEYYNSGLTAFGSRSPSSVRNSATGSASIQPSAKNYWLFTLQSSNSVIKCWRLIFLYSDWPPTYSLCPTKENSMRNTKRRTLAGFHQHIYEWY